jgi:hypothetical protein
MTILAIDPNASDKVYVQGLIDMYNAQPLAASYLNVAPNNNSNIVYVTDNAISATWTSGNLTKIHNTMVEAAATNKTLRGYTQNERGSDALIFINRNEATKPTLNTMIHEIGHLRWQGL